MIFFSTQYVECTRYFHFMYSVVTNACPFAQSVAHSPVQAVCAILGDFSVVPGDCLWQVCISKGAYCLLLFGLDNGAFRTRISGPTSVV